MPSYLATSFFLDLKRSGRSGFTAFLKTAIFYFKELFTYLTMKASHKKSFLLNLFRIILMWETNLLKSKVLCLEWLETIWNWRETMAQWLGRKITSPDVSYVKLLGGFTFFREMLRWKVTCLMAVSLQP